MSLGEKTLATLKMVEEGHFYTMEYRDDYHFDMFLSQGAGSDEDVLQFIGKHVMDGHMTAWNLPKFACSTFSARLKSGDAIFGRNFDQEECMKMVLTTRPEKGYASLSVVNMKYIGFSRENPVTPENRHMLLSAPYAPMDGVNEKGLAVGILMIRQPSTCQNRGNIKITTSTAVRMILDTCATVEEALERLAEKDMCASANVDFHFHIADMHGSSVVVEYINHEMRVLDNRYATNFLLTPGLNVGNGHDRYETLEKTCAGNGGEFADAQEAMDLLRAVSAKSTRWSAVYNQQEKTMMLSLDRKYDKIYSFAL